ncbi:Retrovirus-related Pol polyprotein from transposon RE1 [Vitis vinifera]|uniref:Retrovirus-related Pol polyprotein from transposon RE1 n=1 Tax=Vitis vinifera TaxID=29760 RepID=A0A438FH44_VITVI|nr:Retrovirus-related Pol polyprotein from transposon RE1 [Vitis vinifera]
MIGNETKTTALLELIHSNIWGASLVNSTAGYRYCIHFLDDYTSFRYGLPQPTQIPLLDVHTSPTSQPSMSLSAHAPAPCHPMITRAKAGIFKPKVYAALKHPLSFSLGPIEPMCVKQVLADPNWKIAMKEEYKALMRNDTWDLVPYQPQYNVVGNKWVFKLKFHLDGTLNKHKARLVAKGFHQTPGVDFSETYSPAIKLATIRVVLTLAIAQGWEIRQLDINNAFLNGYLQENVFMSQPKDFIHPTKPHHICKLRKALYGLKQAPRAWFDRLKDALLQWGFQDSKSNASLFLYKTKGIILMPLVYVDNILITGNNSTTILDLVHDLNKSFLLKDLGSLHYFLGIKAFQDETCLYLTQSKYIADLLQKTNMAVAKPLPTPTISKKVLSKSDGDPMDNPTMYRSTVGALQYVTITRPDISYMVSKLSQFLQSPTEIHWKACNRVLLYLKGTITHGGNLISWSSKKQSVVARSRTKSEYRALAHVTAEGKLQVKELKNGIATASTMSSPEAHAIHRTVSSQIGTLQAIENESKNLKKSLKDVVTENEFEKRLLADVIPPSDIEVTFDDIGALENVNDSLKRPCTLNDILITRMLTFMMVSSRGIYAKLRLRYKDVKYLAVGSMDRNLNIFGPLGDDGLISSTLFRKQPSRYFLQSLIISVSEEVVAHGLPSHA